jgi:signal peptidase I
VSAIPVQSSPLAEAYARAYREGLADRPGGVAFGRALLRFAAYAAFGFAVGIAAIVSLPGLIGYQSFTILSGSMEPAIGTGDVILVRSISPLEAEIGDVVTFRSPDEPAKIISHRVRSMQVGDGVVRFVTRGDANTGVERWQVPAKGRIGQVAVHVPKLGYVTNRIGSRFGKLAFLVLPALVLLVSELLRIWRPKSEGENRAPAQ